MAVELGKLGWSANRQWERTEKAAAFRNAAGIATVAREWSQGRSCSVLPVVSTKRSPNK